MPDTASPDLDGESSGTGYQTSTIDPDETHKSIIMLPDQMAVLDLFHDMIVYRYRYRY